MSVVAVIGAQWGDEGKGKVIDMLAAGADVVVRFSGGDNAGHTIVNQHGKFALQLVPSGIFNPGALCIIGNGVAINPEVLLKEMDGLVKRGIEISPENLAISDRANLIMPYHLAVEALEEESRGEKAIGTTRKGIGPVFSDKIARHGIRAGEMLDMNEFRERLQDLLKAKNVILSKVYGAKPLSLEDIMETYDRYAERLTPYIKETTEMLEKAVDGGKSVLMEGAQGTLLDPDFGTYPYATSSSPMAGGVCVGTGVGPAKIDKVIGIFKAYITRVGAGPMPTQLDNATGKMLRERGHEFGTVSGRPRNCGWFDAVAARFSTRINGFTSAAITRLDILDTLPKLKICTAYKAGGETITDFPSRIRVLERCEPVYEEMPGWQADISNIRKFENLPAPARKYIDRLEELVRCPVDFISVGSARDETILKRPVWS